jgi:RNA polymerase sigma-70 factor (ECF subfamily)
MHSFFRGGPMSLFWKAAADLPDETLMVRAQRGDVPALETLYERYSSRLLHYFYRMLGGDAEKSQDFLQDLFLKVVEHPEAFDPGRPFGTWVFSVAHNMCKNEYRRLAVRSRPEVLAEIQLRSAESGSLPVERTVDERAFRKALMAALQTLDEAHRTTFLLRHQEDMPIREISRVLGCAEGTTKSRLHYTTRRLAELLEPLNPFVDAEGVRP